FVYVFMPNTRVRIKAGLLGGIFAGTVYYLLQWAYIRFQVGVVRYDAIYGGFAAIPLLLIWLQLSWMIVLFGAEVAFAADNEETYEFEHDCLGASIHFKRLLGLRITELCVKEFRGDRRPLGEIEIAHRLEVPIRLAREVLFDLVEAKVLAEVRQNGDRDVSYHPARDTAQLSIRTVVEALDRQGNDNVHVIKPKEVEKFAAAVEAMERRLSEAPENQLLRDL
ncbi:unnamed protein product, partial [marine sediment metagenome]